MCTQKENMPPDAGSHNKAGQLPKEESLKGDGRTEMFVLASSQWRSHWKWKWGILAKSCYVSNPPPLVSIHFHSVSLVLSCEVIMTDDCSAAAELFGLLLCSDQDWRQSSVYRKWTGKEAWCLICEFPKVLTVFLSSAPICAISSQHRCPSHRDTQSSHWWVSLVTS